MVSQNFCKISKRSRKRRFRSKWVQSIKQWETGDRYKRCVNIGLHNKEPNMRKLVRFLKDNSGVTAIEYGLIAAGIAVVIIVAVQATGTALNQTFNSVSGALNP